MKINYLYNILSLFKGGFIMKHKNFLIFGIAASAFAIFSFAGCETGSADLASDAVLSQRVSVSLTASGDLTGTTWLADLSSAGVSRIDFTSANTATGVLGKNETAFTYTYDSSLDNYTLTETSTLYTWKFIVNTGNTNLTFPNGFPPYDTGTSVTLERIVIQTSVDSLYNLFQTYWLGYGPRGESTLFVSSYAPGTGIGIIDGTFGPDPTNQFDFTYDYLTGDGEMDGAGEFSTSTANATMTFPDFWGHDEEVVFNLFVYAQ